MSESNRLLGGSTTLGGGAAGIAAVSHSSHALLVGLGAAFIVLIILGTIVRLYALRVIEA